MDFELTVDQESLQEGIRAFLDGRFSLDTVRGIEASGHLDRDRWRELGETGVFSLTLPETDDGLGLGISEATLVFEELGRALVPGPLVATLLAAPWVDGAATGDDDRRVVRAGRARERGRAPTRSGRVAHRRPRWRPSTRPGDARDHPGAPTGRRVDPRVGGRRPRVRRRARGRRRRRRSRPTGRDRAHERPPTRTRVARHRARHCLRQGT